jgi:hypothetical protein
LEGGIELPACQLPTGSSPCTSLSANSSIVDVAGARSTQLIRIKNGGAVTGVCYDALHEAHGITGQ